MDRIEKIQERFLAIHDDLKRKLINGALIRKDMWDSIKKNGSVEEPHYRYRWLLDCVPIVRELMVDLSTEFNHEHREDDRASMRDMVDILKMVIESLETQMRQTAENEDK